MRLNARALTLAVASASALAFAACSILYIALPVALGRLGGAMFHLAPESVAVRVAWGNVFIGLIGWWIFIALVTWVAACLYNRMVARQEERP